MRGDDFRHQCEPPFKDEIADLAYGEKLLIITPVKLKPVCVPAILALLEELVGD
jgi:hypothetical protein